MRGQIVRQITTEGQIGVALIAWGYIYTANIYFYKFFTLIRLISVYMEVPPTFFHPMNVSLPLASSIYIF